MPQHQLDELTARLDAIRHHNDQVKQQHHRQQALAAGRKPHAPKSGRPLQLAFPDRVLAAVLHLRLQLPPDHLAVLLHSTRSTVRRAVTEVQQLLDQHGTTITRATPSAAVTAFLQTANDLPHTATEIEAAS